MGQGQGLALTESLDVSDTDIDTDDDNGVLMSRMVNFDGNGSDGIIRVEDCLSVLVCTGVYSDKRSRKSKSLDHNHRDFIMDSELKKPDMMVLNVYDAVEAIFEKEGFTLWRGNI